MPEEKKQKENPTIVKLEEAQFKDLLVAIDYCITKHLKNITDKLDSLEKLETAITKLEGELKLIRMEISELKEKAKK
jgi:hypothetical protein